MGKEDNALLFVRVGAGDDGHGIVRRAGIVGQVGHVSRDVEEVVWVEHHVVLELRTVPHGAAAAEHVDGGFVTRVFVSLGAPTVSAEMAGAYMRPCFPW